MVVIIKTLKPFVVLAFIIANLSLVCAFEYNVSILSSKANYLIGDRIEVYAEITNIGIKPIEFTLESVFLNEKRTYPVAIIPFYGMIEANNTKKIQLYRLNVSNEFDSDVYHVEAKLYINRNLVGIGATSFEISGMPLDLPIDLGVCKSSWCSKRTKIFIKNEDVYLNYNSDIPDLKLDSKLVYPDGASRDINLPYSFKAEQIGTYELEVTASKEGYKTISKKEMFGIIEEEARITGNAVDSGQDVLLEGTNIVPEQDTVTGNVDNNTQSFLRANIAFVSIMILSLIIAFVIVVMIFRLMRKGKESNDSRSTILNL